MLVSRIFPLRTIRAQYSVALVRNNSTQTDPEHISIPKRIHRSPTDILNALSKTVGQDPTAAHYKYHDDPYLIPQSNLQKRIYAMAQESGRKAARWLRQEHRELFQHSEADPPIKAFYPKMVFTEESEVDEKCLEGLIYDSEVTDATFVYTLMQTKGMPVSDSLKQSLLELLCFFNHTEPLSPELIEERWFQQSLQGKERQRKTWKDGELAELLFTELEPKTSRTYAAIIRGMCKYFQVERAYALFQEAYEKQIELDVETYNSIISITNFLKEAAEPRWELCQDLLNKMNAQGLCPNLGTMNALLSSISSIGNFRLARGVCLQVLGEFKELGVEPSLASWYYVLTTFCRERGPVSHVLVDILNEIEGKEFTIRDPKDTYFFVTAMDVSRNHLHDKHTAKRIDKLLHHGKNYDLIGDSYKESIYYRHLFALLCHTEPLEEFMKTYDLLVPNVYTPEPGIMEEVVRAVETNGALEYIPRLWSDMIIFDHTSRESLVNLVLKIITENRPSADIPTHQDLEERFNTIAWDVYTKIDEQSGARTQRMSFTGQMLGNILSVLSRGKEFEKAKTVFKKLDKSQHQIAGTPSYTSMVEYVDLCVAEKSPTEALDCLEYCIENGLDNVALARKIKEGFTLSEMHIAKLKNLVGDDILKE
ncbi:unnamed protein product [Hermetia illucens]|uniref:Small ribosomal subunit protein mS39 n=1 Tax=Hermetia illucens TaxID=343691 RepID=A0A7R8YPL5_HERIL|nr:protein PTCD3 homolog, mitochondrial [Hermetia illucens]CAD7077516.1 unnamed protein product [Hermetia illucens]